MWLSKKVKTEAMAVKQVCFKTLYDVLRFLLKGIEVHYGETTKVGEKQIEANSRKKGLCRTAIQYIYWKEESTNIPPKSLALDQFGIGFSYG